MVNKENIYKWPFVGNEQIKKYLSKNIDKKNPAGAYIFDGPENLGKTTIAIRFAQMLLCQGKGKAVPCGNCPSCRSFNKGDLNSTGESFSYSDLYIIKKYKDKNNVSIEQVRDLIRAVNMTSFLGSYKIGIIKHADKMSLEAANALLKTLEEPKTKVILILITDQLGNLPPTIRSRSQVLFFRPVKSDDIYNYLVDERGAKRSDAKRISRISIGRPALALKLWEDSRLYEDMRAHAELFFDLSGKDINARLESLSGLIKSKLSSHEQRRHAFRVLEVWEAVARDFLMYKHNHLDRLQFFNADELGKQAAPSANKLSAWYHLIQEGKGQLKANVNYGNVLDSIAMKV